MSGIFVLPARHDDDDDIQDTVGKLSSKIRKNEKNIDISLYLILYTKIL